jgi:diguanylate cyclase (GGDEF)-like protein/PAS domain S-box-containing protein
MAVVVLFAIGGAMGLAEAIDWWGEAAMALAAALVVLIQLEGQRAADADDRPFHDALLWVTALWLAIQTLALVESITHVGAGRLLQFPLVVAFCIACAPCWRAAVRGRLSGVEASAVYLDSAIVFAALAAAALLVLGGSVFDGARAIYALLFAALFFGIIGATLVLSLTLAPIRRRSGWPFAVIGLATVGVGLSVWLADSTREGWAPGIALATVGLVVTAFGGATWTRRPDPSESYRRVALQVRDALPLMAAALAPLLWVLGEVMRDQILREVSAAVAGSVAAVLILCVLRQTILLRERDRIVGLAQSAANRERVLHGELESSERRFRTLVTNSTDVVLIVGRDGRIAYQSPSVERVLGHSPASRLGHPVGVLAHPHDAEYFRSALTELAASPGAERTLELRTRHADGSWRILEATAKNLLDDPAVAGIVINCRDVTERRALEEQLKHEALHDPLTTLANRALFVDRVGHALSRRDQQDNTGVLFMDLDDFKTINDSLGHAAGDELLQAVAQRLRHNLRLEDTVARLGGDEFAVLVEDADITTVVQVGTRLLDALRAPFDIAGKQVHVGASVGVAMSGADNREAEVLLRNADVAMYTAKSRGKGRLEVFEASMHAAAVTRLELKADLERALGRGELRVRYQPIFRLADGALDGFETLVRWRHPDRGEVGPGDFVPLAEETGLIVPIGRWVLTQACRQAQAWRTGGGDGIKISVNLAARQLRDPKVVDMVAGVLAETGLEPDVLTLELTESSIMQDDEGRLQDLRGLRIHLGLDDFGTGYSSLSYLSRFPIETLKIDRSFTSRLGGPDEETALVRSVIQLATSMGMETVGEGIERQEQLDRLRELGCIYGQGYLLARPMDAIRATSLATTGQLEAPAVEA